MKLMLVSLTVVLCIAAYCYSKSQREETDYLKLVMRLQNQHAQDMLPEGYTLGRVGGELCNDVEKIYVGFYSTKALSIDEVRIDFVKGVECFLNRINEDESIKPYLHNYPFTVENLKYSMSFPSRPVDASGMAPIRYVFCYNGVIDYSVYDPAFENTNPIRGVYEEPYSEALRIVREAGLLPHDVIQH